MLGSSMTGVGKLTQEHSDDIKRRMTEAVPTSKGMTFDEIVMELQSGRHLEKRECPGPK